MTDAENDRQPTGDDVPVGDAAEASDDVAASSVEPADASDAAHSTPVVAETVTSQSVRVRRTPRYARFMLVGALVCVVAAFIVTYSFPQGAGYDRNTVFGFMLLVGIAVGVVLGAVAALIADRIARRRARTLTADRIDVRAAQADAPSTSRDA